MCSALMKQQRLFTVVETGENNIDRTSLFVIVIIIAQFSQQVATVLMVEQRSYACMRYERLIIKINE